MSQKSTTVQWTHSALSTIRSTPGDLWFVTLYAVVAMASLQFASLPSPVRAVVALPLLVLVPGYVFLVAAAPSLYGAESPLGQSALWKRVHPTRKLGAVEVVLLSFGLSVALIPLVGGVLWLVFGEFSREVVVYGLGAFALLGVFVAFMRGDTATTGVLDPRAGGRSFRNWLFGSSALETGVNLALVASVVLAASTLTYAFVVPTEGASYTTAMLVTEQDGEFVASGYPTTFSAGEPQPITLQLTSHEHSAMQYTVVVALERTRGSGTDLTVLERSELDRLQVRVPAGETVRTRHEVAPDLVGEDVRLSYYVYRGDAPAEASGSDAYRKLHLWISVTDS